MTGPCARCGEYSQYNATIDGVPFCHGEAQPSCYELEGWKDWRKYVDEAAARVEAQIDQFNRERADRAEAALERVKALHQEVDCEHGCVFGSEPTGWGDEYSHCEVCVTEPWPCPTIQAIEGVAR